ncbi:MAG: hypothetical protein IT379_11465 [Deltaproteobacteria bacterium]|nr:hypothetical protein [Deltaproteobacteria bacterium]
MRRAGLILALLSMLGGCDACSCGGVPSSLRATGAAPFARCTAVQADDREWSVAGLSLAIDDETLSVTGARPSRVAVAVTAGPWPSSATAIAGEMDALVRALKQRVVSVVIVLGGVGDDAELAAPWVARLARVEAAVVLVPGMTERWDAVADVVEHVDDERVIDGTGLRRVVAGNLELVLLAGSDGGAYGVRDACGFDGEDLRTLGALAPRRGATRILVSTVAPRGVGPSAPGLGVAGAPAGSARLAAFARERRIAHVLSAWPVENAGLLHEGGPVAAVVPSIAGLPRVRHDGGRVACGAVVVTAEGTTVRGELVQPMRDGPSASVD